MAPDQCCTQGYGNGTTKSNDTNGNYYGNNCEVHLFIDVPRSFGVLGRYSILPPVALPEERTSRPARWPSKPRAMTG